MKVSCLIPRSWDSLFDLLNMYEEIGKHKNALRMRD